MNNKMPDNLLSNLSEFIAEGMALHFPKGRWRDLERGVSSASEEFGFSDEQAFVEWLMSSPLGREQIKILARHLTISETYFWREPRIFDALEGRILPEIIDLREKDERALRIWSAGCSTGEEPYSIAVALNRAIKKPKDWRITILATDINPWILNKARSGIYNKWSFRNTPEWFKKKYFLYNDHGKTFEIIPEIRDMATFDYLNMAEDIYPSHLNNTNSMDIIFCRNMLMYFSRKRAARIVKNLCKCLVDGGWLIVGASELSHNSFYQLTPVRFPGAVAYRKLSRAVRPQSEIYQKKEICPKEKGMLKPYKTDKFDSPRTSGLFTEKGVISYNEKMTFKEDGFSADIKPRDTECEEDNNKSEDARANRSIADSVRLLADQGRLAEALILCEKAIDGDKLNPLMHYLHGIILQEKNNEAEAITSLKRALYLYPDFIAANFVLGNILMHRGNIRAGKKCYEYVLSLLKNHGPEDVLPEADGMIAGRLREIIHEAMRI